MTGDARETPGAMRDRRLSLFAVIAHMAGVGLTLGLSFPLTSLVMKRWGSAEWSIGLVGAMSSLSILVLMPVLPRMIAWLGAIRSMTIGCVTGAVALLLMPLVPHPVAWGVLRFVIGAGLALPWLVGDVWVNSVARPKSRGTVIAIYAAAFFSGFAIGPIVLDAIGVVGFAPFAAGAGGLLLALAPLLAVARIAPPIELHPHANVLWAVRAAPVVAIAAFVSGFAETMGFSLLALFGLALGLNEASALQLLSVFIAGGIVLQIVVGGLADRVPRLALLGFLGVVLTLCALALPILAASHIVLLVLAFLSGGAVLGVYGLGLTILGERFDASQLPVASAAFLIIYQAGGIAGPVATGFAMGVSAVGGYVVCLGTMGVLIAVAAFRARADGKREVARRDQARGGHTRRSGIS